MSPPRTVTEIQESAMRQGAKWLLRQDPLAVVCLVLLSVLIGGGALGARALAVTYIPQHLESIHQGYEEIQARYLDAQKEQTSKYLADKEALREVHTRELRQMAEQWEKIAERFERVADSNERLVRDLIIRAQKQETANVAPCGDE
jgi:hypothetical protein